MRHHNLGNHPQIRDYGGAPFIFNITHATNMNRNFRTVLWTGKDLQLALMSIPPHEDIGAEMHPDVDQFLRIKNGRAKVYIGKSKAALQEVGYVDENYALLIPAGTWHNVHNETNRALQLYSIYAPPQHPAGTVHQTQADAENEGH